MAHAERAGTLQSQCNRSSLARPRTAAQLPEALGSDPGRHDAVLAQIQPFAVGAVLPMGWLDQTDRLNGTERTITVRLSAALVSDQAHACWCVCRPFRQSIQSVPSLRQGAASLLVATLTTPR